MGNANKNTFFFVCVIVSLVQGKSREDGEMRQEEFRDFKVVEDGIF